MDIVRQSLPNTNYGKSNSPIYYLNTKRLTQVIHGVQRYMCTVFGKTVITAIKTVINLLAGF